MKLVFLMFIITPITPSTSGSYVLPHYEQYVMLPSMEICETIKMAIVAAHPDKVAVMCTDKP